MLKDVFLELYYKFRIMHYNNMSENIYSMSQKGITPMDIYDAEAIFLLDSPTIKEFASFMRISQPNATYKVNNLIKKGFVEKEVDVNDKRKTILKLTDNFFQFNGPKAQFVTDTLTKIENILTNNEINALEKLLYKISDNAMDDKENKMIKILTDSTAYLSCDEAKEMGVEIVPLKVLFEDDTYEDVVELSIEEFYAKLVSNEVLPTTSQPSPSEFLVHFERAKKNNEELIVILISSGLSGTVQSANIAKDMVGYDGIHIIDSMWAVMPMRIMIERAVELRDQNYNAEYIVENLLELRGKIAMTGVIGSLEYLYKGGRLSLAGKVAGTLLNIKPILVMEDGVLKVNSKARGLKKGYYSLVDYMNNIKKPVDISKLYFGYTVDKKITEDFMSLLGEKYEVDYNKIYPIGGVIGTHLGPTGICIVAYICE